MAARCRGAGGPRQDPQGHRSLTPAPDCGPVELGCDAGAMSDHDDDGEELWEAHAGWWQAGFTDGADPEYEEQRSEEHTSELQSLMRISYAVFCLKKKKTKKIQQTEIYKRIE